MEKEIIVSIPKGFRQGTITIKLVISEEDKQTVYNVDRNDVDQHSELIIKPNPTRS